MWNFFGEKQKSNNNLETNKFKIDENKIPVHIGIIMDGNGRWAKKRNMPRSMGHKAGVETLKKIVKESSKLGIKYLTVYAFSTENWKRSADEVNTLMKLLVEYLDKELRELEENGVLLNYIGDITKLPVLCQDKLKNSHERTKNNKGLVLNLALNYGGRSEIVRAFKDIYLKLQNGDISIDEVNEDTLSNYMYTAGMPDPDLIIRPSGEKRLSNFLIWQSAYAEFWYDDLCWPDFTEEHLHKAIYDYQNRDRRFGAVK